jgi:hypothetical protein
MPVTIPIFDPYEDPEGDGCGQDAALQRDAEAAVALLHTLVNCGDRGMPRSMLGACQGLAFITAHKAAIGLSVSQGRGFLIARVETSPSSLDPQCAWSPPVPFTVQQVKFQTWCDYRPS